MVLSSRLIVAMGLGAVGAALLAAPIQGQQDAGVRQTANAGAAGFKDPVPPVIGTIDLDVVFKEYEKVKVSSEEFKAAAMARRNELMKLQNEAAAEVEMLGKLTPNSDDYKKHENNITMLKAKMEAGREQAEREFAAKEAEAMATLYKEIQVMTARMAQARKMTYIVKVSNQPITGENPNSVMAAMANMMVYADPRNDITNDVVHNLNKIYRASGGQPAPAAATAPAGTAATGASAPAAAPAAPPAGR